jgi:hypothetical protein
MHLPLEIRCNDNYYPSGELHLVGFGIFEPIMGSVSGQAVLALALGNHFSDATAAIAFHATLA